MLVSVKATLVYHPAQFFCPLRANCNGFWMTQASDPLTNKRKTGLLTLLLSLSPALLAEPPASAPAPDASQTLQLISTLENPAPYRWLDWLPASELNRLPAAQRPQHQGLCEGLYLAPIIEPDDPTLPENESPIKAAADRYQTDADGGVLLQGSVIIQQGRRQLESDEISYQQTTTETQLTGNVRIRQPGMLMTGERARLNLDDKSLEIHQANYVIHQQRIHGSAGKIYNTGEAVLVFDRSTYTTCEPHSISWQLSAGKIQLNQASGWGSAQHVVLKIRRIPVLYIPWFSFPITDQRQTGVLFPSIANSNESGTEIAAPLYLNLAPNYDATLTPRYISKRGEQLEAEFRYLNGLGEGQLGAAYLDDRSYDNEPRTLALWRHHAQYGEHLSFQGHYTRVSDQDYFRHLSTELDARGDIHLDQFVEAAYQAKHWRFSARVHSYQTLDRLIADPDLPYRRVPQLRLQADSPEYRGFSAFWRSEMVHFEHPEPDASPDYTNAVRSYLAPGVQYHWARPAGYMTARVQSVIRHYELNSDQPALERSDTLVQPVSSLDAGLFFERYQQVGRTRYVQTLEPRIFYLHSPFRAQNDLPLFDTSQMTFSYAQMFRENRFSGIDRINDANQLTLGLSSTWQEVGQGDPLLSASIGQIYYFEDRKVVGNHAATETLTPRSAVAGQLAWHPANNLQLAFSGNWTESNNNIDSGSMVARYGVNDQGVVNLGYRYYDDLSDAAPVNEERIDQTDVSMAWTLYDHWQTFGRWRYDLEQHRSFDNLLGIAYNNCCWGASLLYRRHLKESDDDASDVKSNAGIYLQFQLYGLGNLGTQNDRLLDESIPGLHLMNASRN